MGEPKSLCTCWFENTKNKQIFYFVGFGWMLCQDLWSRSIFCFGFKGHRAQPCLFFFQWRAENSWLIIEYTLLPHIPALHMTSKTQCQTQNGSAHGHIFKTFECQVWTNCVANQLKNCFRSSFWLTWKMWVCNDQFFASWLSVYFLGHYAYDKCQILFDGLIELYPFILLSVTLIVFQSHGSVKQFLTENFMFLST